MARQHGGEHLNGLLFFALLLHGHAALHGRFNARGNDGDAHFVGGVGIKDRTEKDLGIFVDGLGDGGGGLIDFLDGQIRAAGDVHENTLGSIDGDVFQQRAGDGLQAASRARDSPRAVPKPIMANPISLMTALTSAKSRLIRPGTMMRSEMPLTA